MRVLFLQRQPCIRAMKYAIGIRGAHPEVTLGFAYQGRTLTGWYGTGDEHFSDWWRLPATAPGDGLEAAVEEFQPDLIHSHNLPDVLTVLALERVGDSIPVVHDVHDMQSLRRTPYEDGFDDPEDPLDAEAAAVEGSAALIAVSAEMLRAIHARHGPPRRSMLFANYALARDLAPGRVRSPLAGAPPRVVYQGSLSDNGSHYDLRDHFAAIAASGLPIDVFPNRDAPAYRRLAARTPRMRVMETLTPADLLRRLPAYDVGWAAFNTGLNAAHLDTALPNKAFEYLASGIPIAAGRHRALEGLIAEHGVGVVVDHPSDLAGAIESAGYRDLSERVIEKRHLFTVEGHIGELVALYRETIAAHSAQAVPAGQASGPGGRDPG